jgi:PAS domain S-box-containing protein
MALRDLLKAIAQKQAARPESPAGTQPTNGSAAAPPSASAPPPAADPAESMDASLMNLTEQFSEISKLLSDPPPAASSAPTSSAGSPAKGKDISLYKNLLSGLYDGVLIFDFKGSVIASNKRAETFLGYSEPELWGMQCESLITGVNARILYKLNTNAEAGRFTVVTGTCKRKDGTTFPAEIAISKIHLLNEGDLIFSIRNLERREKARESREFGEDAVRHNGSGIVVCSTDGAIVFANPAFLKLLKMEDEQEVLQHMIGDFCDSHEQVKAMIHAPSSQGTWLGNLRLVSPKGVQCDVLVTAALSTLRRNSAAHLVLNMTPLPKSIT